MRVAAIQHDIVWEDRDATLANLAPKVVEAAAAGAELIVLTEMFATGFSMRSHLTAEAEDGPTVNWMQRQAQAEGVVLAASVPLVGEEGDLATNSLMVVNDQGPLYRYDKRHPFSYAGEHERFAPGTRDVIADLGDVRWGLTVCYDLRFADQYWRMGPDVDAFIVVANWPASRREHWCGLLRARAIENQAYVIGVNRVGEAGAQGQLSYVGDSCILDPLGRELAVAAYDPTILFAQVEPERVTQVRERFPFIQDR